MEWKYVRLDEFCDSVRDGTHDTPKKTDSGYKLITAKHINNDGIDFSEAYLISEEDYNHINERSKVEKWDVLMSMIGNGLGKSFIVSKEPDYAIKNLALFKTGNEYKAKWLHYFLSSSFGQGIINSKLQGTGQPFISLSFLRKMKIIIPSLEKEMIKIASILSTYDTLIENNTKRIRLLEQMAENLYKEWFVRFRFPGHENVEMENGLPKGWKKGTLKDICEFKRGKNITADEMSEGNVPVISAGITPSGYHNQANVKGVSVTMSSSGANAGYISFHYSDIWAADCSFVDSRATKHIYYVYELLNNMRVVINNFQRGAAQPHVYPKDINRVRLIIPEESLIAKANEHLKVIHDEIKNFQEQNQLLTRQRDLLLPRLMSGKLEVMVK